MASTQNKAAQRRSLRLERRELLYAVIRESMLHAGVLSSTYKFKVLSLDPQGLQYLIMVDLACGLKKEMGGLADIEGHMARAAKARHDILVTAVYWRVSEQASEGGGRTTHSPVHASKGDEKLTASGHQTVEEHVQEPVPETGFADTELAALDQRASPLSGTQYGDLK